MFCPKCGAVIEGEVKFCKQCGARLPENGAIDPGRKAPAHVVRNDQEKTVFNKRIPTWAAVLIGVAVMAALVAGLWAGGIVGPGGRSLSRTESGSTERATVEGEGFETPEDAVCAYLEALKEGDFERMLSTFAVESYCENFDRASLAAKGRMVSDSSIIYNPLSPTENPFIAERNIETRRAEMVNEINWHLLKMAVAASSDLTWEEQSADSEEREGELDAILHGYPISYTEGENGTEWAEDLIKKLQNVPDLRQLNIGDILPGEAIDPGYFTAPNMLNLKETAEMMGAEGIKCLAVRFSVDELEGIVFMDTAKYQGRWYNITSEGNLAALANISNAGMQIARPDSTFETFLSEAKQNEAEARAGFAETDLDSSESELKEMFGMTKNEFLEFFALDDLK